MVRVTHVPWSVLCHGVNLCVLRCQRGCSSVNKMRSYPRRLLLIPDTVAEPKYHSSHMPISSNISTQEHTITHMVHTGICIRCRNRFPRTPIVPICINHHIRWPFIVIIAELVWVSAFLCVFFVCQLYAWQRCRKHLSVCCASLAVRCAFWAPSGFKRTYYIVCDARPNNKQGLLTRFTPRDNFPPDGPVIDAAARMWNVFVSLFEGGVGVRFVSGLLQLVSVVAVLLRTVRDWSAFSGVCGC